MSMSRGTKTFVLILLGLAALAALFPMAWMASSAFKPESEIYQDPPTWIPDHFTFQNFTDLFTRFQFGLLTRNSVIISLGVVLISLVLGGMAAYGFSRYSFPGSNFLLGALLFTRMITPSSLVVPLFSLMQALDRLDTLESIIAGVAVLNLPFVVWMLKPFFDELPREVEEAGEIDGLSPFSVFWRISVPMAAPGLYTVLLFSFIAGWVDLLFGISFSTIPEAMPLTAGLMQMQTGYKIYWGAMMAGGLYLSPRKMRKDRRSSAVPSVV
ncbi:MAG TPA: carbohydrate ABC transporter permease [Anaerolineaceae bacterium]|nr:carbohydrate ABC transporter permease [Anaerolineaceae bacterium]